MKSLERNVGMMGCNRFDTRQTDTAGYGQALSAGNVMRVTSIPRDEHASDVNHRPTCSAFCAQYKRAIILTTSQLATVLLILHQQPRAGDLNNTPAIVSKTRRNRDSISSSKRSSHTALCLCPHLQPSWPMGYRIYAFSQPNLVASHDDSKL